MPNRVRAALLLAALGGLGGCEAAIAARQERMKNDAVAMRSSGAPKDYRELVQVALRRHLARPDTFAGGLIGPPRQGATSSVLTQGGRTLEHTRQTTAVGWVVCARYSARSIFGYEVKSDSAVFINAQGAVTDVHSHSGGQPCAAMPDSLMEPFTL
jgi:hypothetical protein